MTLNQAFVFLSCFVLRNTCWQALTLKQAFVFLSCFVFRNTCWQALTLNQAFVYLSCFVLRNTCLRSRRSLPLAGGVEVLRWSAAVTYPSRLSASALPHRSHSLLQQPSHHTSQAVWHRYVCNSHIGNKDSGEYQYQLPLGSGTFLTVMGGNGTFLTLLGGKGTFLTVMGGNQWNILDCNGWQSMEHSWLWWVAVNGTFLTVMVSNGTYLTVMGGS